MQDAVFFESPFDIRKVYEDGFIGANTTPEDKAELRDMVRLNSGWPTASMACSAFGLEETGKDQLVIPFLETLKLYPDCWPGGAQGRGDCVSWCARNAALLSMCCEIAAGLPDEVTGMVEGAPVVSDVARRNGVLCTETHYNWRGYNGDGWSAARAVRVLINQSGLWLRQNYPEINVDFTKYSARNAGIYGSRTPPESWAAIGRQHLMRTATEIESFEELRDMLANGYGVLSDGGESWSDERDANGVSKRTRRGWSHSMAVTAVDDRPVIKKLYGEPLGLIQQSWGDWNYGPDVIYGTNIRIPTGAFWSRWSDMKNRYFVALSGTNGWKRQPLKNYGAIGRI